VWPIEYLLAFLAGHSGLELSTVFSPFSRLSKK
jgi:hypothetical protein